MPYQIDSPLPFPGPVIPDASSTRSGLMSAAQAAKLAGISPGGAGGSFQEVLSATMASGGPPFVDLPIVNNSLVLLTTDGSAAKNAGKLPDGGATPLLVRYQLDVITNPADVECSVVPVTGRNILASQFKNVLDYADFLWWPAFGQWLALDCGGNATILGAPNSFQNAGIGNDGAAVQSVVSPVIYEVGDAGTLGQNDTISLFKLDAVGTVFTIPDHENWRVDKATRLLSAVSLSAPGNTVVIGATSKTGWTSLTLNAAQSWGEVLWDGTTYRMLRYGGGAIVV